MPGSPSLLVVVTGTPTEPVAARRGDFVAILRDALGPSFRGNIDSVDARTEALAGRSRATDAVLITGSASHVHHREPWVLAAEAWLREEVADGRPILGLCFGHQLLASALGGVVLPNPLGREMGTVELERLEEDTLLDGLPARFAANTCHLDTVTALPAGARVLLRSELDFYQCVRFAPRCYGVQFHPEFDGDVMRGYIEARREQLLAEGRDARRMHEAASDTPEASRLLANFLEHV
ncbi:MAG: glutamine amidotransferase, partial [Deltaproteobacteria bacterium]|nr:glutamine amidotransferase [Deltaproteobacteria bacterium]